MSIKPFPYDAAESPNAIVFLFRNAVPLNPKNWDQKWKRELEIHPKGIKIFRPDKVEHRFINLHPRLQENIKRKPVYALELVDLNFAIYSANSRDSETPDIQQLLGRSFYWYIGPETASIADVQRRPLAEAVNLLSPLVLAAAPGQTDSGPLIGLCKTQLNILALSPGRDWIHTKMGTVIEAGLAEGNSTGFPANNDVDFSVHRAHQPNMAPNEYRPRAAWKSQIATALTLG